MRKPQILAQESLNKFSMIGSRLKPKLLLIDDDKNFSAEVAKTLSEIYEVTLADDPTLGHRILNQEKPDLLLLDYGLPGLSGLEMLKILRRRMPDLPIIMITGESGVETVIETMKAGANDYIIKGTEDFEGNLKFRISQALECSAILKRYAEVRKENDIHTERNRRLVEKIESENRNYEILGSDEKTLKLKRDMLRLKGEDAYVLITGENGTGKELIARGLNLQENDRSRPFIAINCAAISTSLFESEFFGHIKGSFTGASENKVGQFKLADGGDIFLDEIGEVPLAMQAKLLRVLQEKTFTPVGSTKSITVEVRVIAATNRDLEAEIAKGNFREDLYYRLNRITLRSPALRERPSDIIPLAEEFLRRRMPAAKISEPAKKALLTYPWRGNIRELQNVVERASVLAKDSNRPILKLEHLALSEHQAIGPQASLPLGILPRSKDDISAERRQNAINWIDRLFWEEGHKFSKENQEFYSRIGISKTYYYERKKELFTENTAEEVAT